ncbi:DUF447 domain-containing protein [Halopenitus sp. H-Gu1]|uniref:DUF447 domain-containing protein n=1 Tax=Halopenitus sp. H-Gu1 TaxID=3242697 RepID=UPI00359CE2D5
MSPERSSDWPVRLRGVTESIVTTLGPNDRWNVAALGLHAPTAERAMVTARTYGRTRTRRNFERQGGGIVQFTVDPREFVEAALAIDERSEPVLEGTDAWVEIEVEHVGTEREGDTEIATWELDAVESTILEERVPTINRGFGAVIEATVAASRLDVPTYDETELRSRLAHLAETVDRCGGPREREAFARIDELTGWRDRNEPF